MLLVDDLAAGGTKNLRHTPRGLVTLSTADKSKLSYRLKPKVIIQTSLLKKENAARAYSKKNYDVRHRARNMTPLRAGDNVHVKSFNIDGKVLKAAD